MLCLIKINRVLIRMAEKAGKPFAPLHESGVVWKQEPWAGVRVEEFANIKQVYDRKWGDCDDMLAYRLCAEDRAELPAQTRRLEGEADGEVDP